MQHLKNIDANNTSHAKQANAKVIPFAFTEQNVPLNSIYDMIENLPNENTAQKKTGSRDKIGFIN